MRVSQGQSAASPSLYKTRPGGQSGAMASCRGFMSAAILPDPGLRPGVVWSGGPRIRVWHPGAPTYQQIIVLEEERFFFGRRAFQKSGLILISVYRKESKRVRNFPELSGTFLNF